MANHSRPTSPPCDHKEATESTIHDEKQTNDGAVVTGGDYSGAVAKTDPAEIALVRKLDRMIMVSCSDLFEALY